MAAVHAVEQVATLLTREVLNDKMTYLTFPVAAIPAAALSGVALPDNPTAGERSTTKEKP